MIILYLALKLTFLACLLNTGTVFGKKEGSLVDHIKLHGDLGDGGCEVGVDGIVTCKEDDFESNCTDNHESCAGWASSGECDTNPAFMLDMCKKSCNSCPPNCVDEHESCSHWASMGECNSNPNYMLKNCKKSCKHCQMHDHESMNTKERNYYMNAIQAYGTPQTAVGDQKSETISKVRETVLYMRNYVHAENSTHNMTQEVIRSCQNKNELCAFWAVIGDCERKAVEAFMHTSCAPVCQCCENIDMDVRCGKRDPNENPSLHSGELNLMFERIIQTAPGNQTKNSKIAALESKVQDNGTPYYTVNVHSRPKSTYTSLQEGADVVSVDKKRDLDEDPFVITMDNFLTEEECEFLIQSGHQNGYQQSVDVDGVDVDGTLTSKYSAGRTSSNTWCNEKSGCKTSPHVQRIMKRLENVTQITMKNYEDFQILKYDVGQFYKLHHDYILLQKDRLCGPRILTFFLYLSDVDEGGGTSFEELGIVITPKRGRALLWPSVLNHDPSFMDTRMRHEALVVKKGTKYAANAWIHLYNHEDTQKRSCQ